MHRSLPAAVDEYDILLFIISLAGPAGWIYYCSPNCSTYRPILLIQLFKFISEFHDPSSTL